MGLDTLSTYAEKAIWWWKGCHGFRSNKESANAILKGHYDKKKVKGDTLKGGKLLQIQE